MLFFLRKLNKNAIKHNIKQKSYTYLPSEPIINAVCLLFCIDHGKNCIEMEKKK